MKLGSKTPEATKQKMREAWARRRAAGIKHRGHKHSDDERLAISLRMLGTKASPASKEKMRQAKLKNPTRYWLGKKRGPQTDSWKAAISRANKGRVISPEHTAKIVAKTTGKKRSPEVAAKLRAIAVKAMTPEMRLRISTSRKGKYMGKANKQWGKPPAHGKRIKYNGSIFRSTYEVRFAKAFDALGIRWIYEPRRFDLGTCTYLPDFYLPDFNTYCEVKGWLGPDSIKKNALFSKTFPDIPWLLLMEPELKDAELHAASA